VRLLIALSVICIPAQGIAVASQSVSISATFAPKRLGATTAVTLGFEVTANAGQVPSPLTGVDFNYPADLGLARSELGVASCPIAPLEADGPVVCPPNSIMGSGSALVAIPVGGGVQAETAKIALLAGPPQENFLRLLVAITGKSPVIARVVMSSLLLDGHLQLTAPLVESLPEGPNVSFVRLRVTIGGHLTYFEHRRGKIVAYRPKGVALPPTCPRGGFRFSGRFSFEDGTQAYARTTVACPGRGHIRVAGRARA
jgi:hypothetical protein